MHPSGASGSTQRAKAKLQLSKYFFFSPPKHCWKTDMTFSPRLECSALCVYFLFCSSEIRRGADEPNEQHRRRGDVSALKVLAPEQGSCFPDEREHEGETRRTASWATKDQGGTSRFVGLSRRPACEWDLMNWSGLCISLRMEQQSRHSRSTVSCKLIVHIHPGDEPIENN